MSKKKETVYFVDTFGNEELSSAIQKKAFELGYKWEVMSKEQLVKFTDKKILCFYENSMILWSYGVTISDNLRLQQKLVELSISDVFSGKLPEVNRRKKEFHVIEDGKILLIDGEEIELREVLRALIKRMKIETIKKTGKGSMMNLLLIENNDDEDSFWEVEEADVRAALGME